MYHVERRDVPAVVTPEHRPRVGVLDRVAPDRRIEIRDAHANHAVATIALGERVAEDLVQIGDVLEPRPERAVDGVRWAPRASRDHQSAAPIVSCAASSKADVPNVGSCSTRDAPVSSS